MENERVVPDDISKLRKFNLILDELKIHFGATPDEQVENLRAQTFKARELVRREVEVRLYKEEGLI